MKEEEMKLLLEKLAALEHEQWIQWSQAIAAHEDISNERLKRWKSLWKPYDELTEGDKEMDRVWASKAVAKMIEFMESLTKKPYPKK